LVELCPFRRDGSISGERDPASKVQAGLVSGDCELQQASGRAQRQSVRPNGKALIASGVVLLALPFSSPLTTAPFLVLVGDHGRDRRKRRRDRAGLEQRAAEGRRFRGGGALSTVLRRVVFREFGGERCAGSAQRQCAGGDLEKLVGSRDI
jgi:hypothetical protein